LLFLLFAGLTISDGDDYLTRYWFISPKYRTGSTLALITFALAFVVIILGAYTRLTDAGLSCPDWPHCFGHLTAPYTNMQLKQVSALYPSLVVNIKKAWTEMIHRYMAGTEGLLILLLSFSILVTRQARDAKSVFISISLIMLLALQVVLGMLTVTEKLKPIIVLSHLLTGLSILSLLWWAYLNLHAHDHFTEQRSSSLFIPWLWIGLIIVGLQIMLGGWVSSHYAGLACIDFPYCQGQILPLLHLDRFGEDLITIHMLHRIGAVITAVYITIFSLFLLKKPSFRAMGSLLLALISLQITLGILNIIWLRPVWIALIHHAAAIFLLLTMITGLVKAHFESRDHRYAFRIR
jgi:cytochrome c oxidase assembly protein subunit 15